VVNVDAVVVIGVTRDFEVSFVSLKIQQATEWEVSYRINCGLTQLHRAP
jgi:hypothetical protein